MACGDRLSARSIGRAARGLRLVVGLIVGCLVLAASGPVRAQPAYPPANPPVYPGSDGPPPPGAPPAPWGAPNAPNANPYPYPPPGAAPPGQWGAPTAPAAPAPGYGPRWVHVVMNSDDPRTRIDRVVGGGAIMPVCFAPCDRMLETNNLYIIQGDGVRATSRFMLPDDRDSVTLNVQAGSTARIAGGAILLGGGLLSAYIGALVWSAGTISNSDGFNTPGQGNNAVSVGRTMVVVGLGGAVVGLYLALTSHTTVNSSTGAIFTRDSARPRAWPRLALTPRGLQF